MVFYRDGEVSLCLCVCVCVCEKERVNEKRDYSAVCDLQTDLTRSSDRMERWTPACASSARLSVIEKAARLRCLGICSSIMQLQNRKTNSGNRPPNVINFVGAGG